MAVAGTDRVRRAPAAFAQPGFRGKRTWEDLMMGQKSLRQRADEAEARAARLVTERPRVTEADLAEVMDVDAVDEYVAATGEYPLSGDLAEGELGDIGMVSDASV